MEGDRKAYSEESRILIGKQRMNGVNRYAIEKLQKDNDHLQNELRLLEQRSEDKRKNGIQSKKAESMAEQAGKMNTDTKYLDLLQRKIKFILSQITELDQETTKINSEIDVQRSKLGGVNAASQNNDAVGKQVRVLENRLDKALVKFNKSLAVNKRLRAIIDNLRRERLVFDNIYHKFERELIEQKRQMADIIETSNAAYEARDEAQTKIIALREKAEKEHQSYIQEIKELDRSLEQDRKLKEFMAAKGSDRSERADGNREGGKKGEKEKLSGAKFPSQENLTVPLDTYKSAFSEIRKVTGISDTGELVQRFKGIEDQNFSLFNYVNEVNNEIEMNAEEMVEIQKRIDAMRIECVLIEESRKMEMQSLEESLNASNEKANAHEKQYKEMTSIMSDLRSSIEGLIQTFQKTSKRHVLSTDSQVADTEIKDNAADDASPSVENDFSITDQDGNEKSQQIVPDEAGDVSPANDGSENVETTTSNESIDEASKDSASHSHQQSHQPAPSSAQPPRTKKSERVRVHLEFNLPSESIGSQGVTEANLIQFLGLIEHKSNELLTLNYLINSPKKAVAQLAGLEGQDGAISLIGAGGVAGLLGQGPGAPVGTLSIVAPSTGDDHDSGDNQSDEDDRPLTREELRQKTLRGVSHCIIV
ncbi:hypothetical protein BDEG_26697 [Batrachochytrium dendrobatidis JEL423]|uniref:ODAD1 central coiled coil region domain-containing protein n=1 Tax=Batrachochytrium dendrobatidis (strain JEL423) TaxID=403673 RepID=A0A177WV92_BATDL|nr:hypothetical protein BDEG_26697 [Batrachochytrium dendrobatidis JEL423]